MVFPSRLYLRENSQRRLFLQQGRDQPCSVPESPERWARSVQDSQGQPLKKTPEGTRMAQSVSCLTLDFSTGHNLHVVRSSPT